MKILHTVEFYHPSVGGMQEVVRQISEHLAGLGHQVTVATTVLAGRRDKSVNGVEIAEFSISGNLAKGLQGEVDRYRDFVFDSGFEIVTNFAAQQWATDAMLPVIDRLRAKKVFVPTGFSGLYAPEYAAYFNEMKKWMKMYDANIFLSNNYRDINFARENGITNIKIIPNGASETEFLPETSLDIRKKLGIPRHHFLILHVGSHTGQKGHREAIKIFNRAGIKNATLLIVANSFGGGCTSSCQRQSSLFKFSPWRLVDGKKLIVTFLDRTDTVAAYKEADLFLFPSNIECSPLVLFECMAAQTPFLTTDVGNAAEIIEWSGSGSLLPGTVLSNGKVKAKIGASARVLEEIINDGPRRDAMKKDGFKAWQDRFTWAQIAGEYEKLYQDLINI